MFFDNVREVDDDYQKLIRFITGLEKLFVYYFENPRYQGERMIFIPWLFEPLPLVFPLVRERMAMVQKMLEMREYEPQLWQHGLLGIELDAKLVSVQSADTELQRLAVNGGMSVEAYKKHNWFMKKFIDIIDVPLESLLQAIGAHGAIAEFKQLFGLAIDDSQ